jgi:type IV pilus assembly protein PilA
MKKRQAGFTLIELLVVIGILAVLLAIVLIAINPARQFSQANNAKRASDVNALLNAIHQYSADNKGNISALTIPLTTPAVIESTVFGTLCTKLVPTYIAALPVDPLTNNGAPVSDCAVAGGWSTNYEVSQSATDSRITVSAPATELGIPIISVLR